MQAFMQDRVEERRQRAEDRREREMRMELYNLERLREEERRDRREEQRQKEEDRRHEQQQMFMMAFMSNMGWNRPAPQL